MNPHSTSIHGNFTSAFSFPSFPPPTAVSSTILSPGPPSRTTLELQLTLSPCPLPSLHPGGHHYHSGHALCFPHHLTLSPSAPILCPLQTSQHAAPGFPPCVKNPCLHSCFSELHLLFFFLFPEQTWVLLSHNWLLPSQKRQKKKKKAKNSPGPSKALVAIRCLFDLSSFSQGMPCLLTPETLSTKTACCGVFVRCLAQKGPPVIE